MWLEDTRNEFSQLMEEIVVYVATRLRAVMVIRIQLGIVVVVVAVNEGDTSSFEDFNWSS